MDLQDGCLSADGFTDDIRWKLILDDCQFIMSLALESALVPAIDPG
jgi:hypothetical protein